MKETITNILQAGAFFGMIFSGYLFLETRHAPSEVDVDLQLKMIELDIKKDAEARAYYFDKQSEIGKLDGPDERRMRNLESNLDQKYRKQEMLMQRLENVGQ